MHCCVLYSSVNTVRVWHFYFSIQVHHKQKKLFILFIALKKNIYTSKYFFWLMSTQKIYIFNEPNKKVLFFINTEILAYWNICLHTVQSMNSFKLFLCCSFVLSFAASWPGLPWYKRSIISLGFSRLYKRFKNKYCYFWKSVQMPSIAGVKTKISCFKKLSRRGSTHHDRVLTLTWENKKESTIADDQAPQSTSDCVKTSNTFLICSLQNLRPRGKRYFWHRLQFRSG